MQAKIHQENYTGFVVLFAARPTEILSPPLPGSTHDVKCYRCQSVVPLSLSSPFVIAGDSIPLFGVAL
jgi:hypothetical protein